MSKKFITIITILLLGAGTVYFYGDIEEEVVKEKPHITGYILNITHEAQSLLVAEGLATEEYTGDIEELEGNAIYLMVGEETKIMKEDTEISLEDLKVGEKVEAWTTGIILESYPARGKASKIIVIEEKELSEEEAEKEIEEEAKKEEVEKEDENDDKEEHKEERQNLNGKEEKVMKECFVGGCSGELCTDNPEAISTCEYISGMECLRKGMSCELVENECEWVMSREAARCFREVEEEHGDTVRKTRIGYLFEKAESFLNNL